MLVAVLRQCDVTFEGEGHSSERTQALFEGQTYDLPEELARPLIERGLLVEHEDGKATVESEQPKARRKAK